MIHLITGASASGKSAYAERQAAGAGRIKYYVATMHNDGSKELADRINKHRRQRDGYGFLTLEREKDIGGITIEKDSVVLVECLSNLLANEIYQNNRTAKEAAQVIVSDVKKLSQKCEHLIIVTNEVFSDGVEHDAQTERYIEALAAINCRIAECAGRVTEVVYTIPIEIKGEPG